MNNVSIDTLTANILNDVELRQSLSELRKLIKTSSYYNELRGLTACGSPLYEAICNAIHSTDAKSRKNAALLMGDLCIPEFLPILFSGYESEEQLFVKSSYLSAMKEFNYFEYMPQLRDYLYELTSTETTPENKKHIDEQVRELNDLIIAIDGITAHKFTGYSNNFDCILLTNRLHTETVLEQIGELTDGMHEAKAFNAGIQLHTSDIGEILRLRTYNELLFRIQGLSSCVMDPLQSASAFAKSDLFNFLKSNHNGDFPFYFRVEVKSKMELDKRSTFAKKFSSELERLSGRQLVNSTSDYEIEIRLIENKNGMFNCLIKLGTLPDNRFSYRQESIATSLRPASAALLVTLAKEYMIKDAKVLDPFCGVGTMLIERQMQVKANTSYGIDINPDAIDKARINTEAAGQIIHYINRDFFTFEHEHLFDEVFTNMPVVTNHKTEDEIYDIYKSFFRTVRDFITEDGTIIMYTHNRGFVKELAREYKYTILDEFMITDKNKSYLIILK